jgi:hypothetical protein
LDSDQKKVVNEILGELRKMQTRIKSNKPEDEGLRNKTYFLLETVPRIMEFQEKQRRLNLDGSERGLMEQRVAHTWNACIDGTHNKTAELVDSVSDKVWRILEKKDGKEEKKSAVRPIVIFKFY